MTKVRTYIAALTCVWGIAGNTAWAQDPEISWELDDALRQVDRQADDFDSAMAAVVMVRTDDAGDEMERLEGVAFVKKDGDMRVSVSSPDTRHYLMDRRDLYIHMPEEELVQEYYLPRHPNQLAPFMRLGFSETGRDLRDDYLVTAIGERVIGDRRALGLDLTPKKDADRARVKRVHLWIDQASWMPVEQVIESTETGETLTVSYERMARNLQLNPDLFKREWPRGTERVKMK